MLFSLYYRGILFAWTNLPLWMNIFCIAKKIHGQLTQRQFHSSFLGLLDMICVRCMTFGALLYKLFYRFLFQTFLFQMPLTPNLAGQVSWTFKDIAWLLKPRSSIYYNIKLHTWPAVSSSQLISHPEISTEPQKLFRFENQFLGHF